MVGIICPLIEIGLDLPKSGGTGASSASPLPPVPTVMKEGRARGKKKKKDVFIVCAPLTLEKSLELKLGLTLLQARKQPSHSVSI